MHLRRRLPFALLFILAVPQGIYPALARALPVPEGEVLLVVSGNIERTNVDGEAHFDEAMLRELPCRTIETHTPWTDGPSQFEGPLARALIDTVGTDSQSVRVKALNDFAADVPISDFYNYDVILALDRDGEPMAIRDYGPIFILYPFDEHPHLLNERIRFRSVWQVGNIHAD